MWKGGGGASHLLEWLAVVTISFTGNSEAEHNVSKSVTNKQCIKCYAFLSSRVFCFAFAVFYKETNIFTAISNITSTFGIPIP